VKTDELIKVLSTNVAPANRRQVVQEVVAAIAIGTVIAVITILVSRGIRTDLNDIRALGFLLLKLAFATVIVISASAYLVRLARPGGETKTSLMLAAWPFMCIALLAAISLVFAPLWHLHTAVMGDRWLECLVSIPLIAILPFAVVVWTLRRMAPTDLTRTGALAGLLAGGISAVGYALHCTGDSIPFIALWYGGTIAFCTFIGAVLGPRLLRW